MATRRVSFYLDESLSSRIVAQLRRQDIDIIRGPLGADDPVHLARATEMGRVVCTVDDDFLKLAAQGIEHAGIIWGEQDKYSIGDWIRYLRFIHAACDADELQNEVYFVFHVD
ncbi:MAG: DUF5615 family PIN-like protein [Chloroflexi bacterium]|nr:DUF5615 family PIN-like protein [Chloroflexota bacterium]